MMYKGHGSERQREEQSRRPEIAQGFPGDMQGDIVFRIVVIKAPVKAVAVATLSGQYTTTIVSQSSPQHRR